MGFQSSSGSCVYNHMLVNPETLSTRSCQLTHGGVDTEHSRTSPAVHVLILCFSIIRICQIKATSLKIKHQI